MTNQTDTERDEAKQAEREMAIHYLQELANKQSCIEYFESIDLAITALRSQSEAERKVEKVRAECEMRIEFHHRMDCSQAKISDQAYYRVLEVLNREGKADERE